MKKSFVLAAIVSAAAVTGSVLLTSMNPAGAIPCGLFKNKGATTTTANDAPTLSATKLDSNEMDTKKMGFLGAGAGLAAVAGLLAAGMVYKARRTRQEAEAAVAEIAQDESLEVSSFSIPVHPELLCVSTSEQDSSDAADKDLTLVG